MSSENSTVLEEKAANAISATFTEKGQFKDEVTLIFDDGKELYVSQNLLTLSSPVFRAMFENDFLEKNEKAVRLPGKDYDDVLEFLLCIHPAVMKKIDESTVVRIVPIAEEYQVLSISSKCKKVMKKIVKKEMEKIDSAKYDYCPRTNTEVVSARKLLLFLNTATMFNFDDVTDVIINALVRFPSVIYSGFECKSIDAKEYHQSLNYGSVRVNGNHVTKQELHAECLDIFRKLPFEVRLRINSQRLHMVDKQNFL